jgi:hypothetical protein
MLHRFCASGELAWSVRLGRFNGSGIVGVPDGSFLVAGWLSRSLGDGVRERMVAWNITRTGSILWRKTIPAVGREQAAGAALGADDSLLVVGSRSVEGIPTRAVIHRLTVRGTVLSSHLLGRTGWDYSGTAAVGTESGNLYIAGTRESRVSADVPVQAFLVKAGPLGNRDWERPLLIPPRADGRVTAATDLAMKPAGAVVAVGSAGGSPGGHDPGDDVDTVVVSFDPNGGRQWTRVTSPGRRNEGISVAVGSDGTSYVGGLTAGFHCSYSRFILRAFRDDGTFRYARSIRPKRTGSAAGLDVLPDGGVVVGGVLEADPGGSHTQDAVLARIDPTVPGRPAGSSLELCPPAG